MSLKEHQSLVASWNCVFQLSVAEAQVLGGLRRELINNLIFPTWASAAGFNNNFDRPFDSEFLAPMQHLRPVCSAFSDL